LENDSLNNFCQTTKQQSHPKHKTTLKNNKILSIHNFMV